MKFNYYSLVNVKAVDDAEKIIRHYGGTPITLSGGTIYFIAYGDEVAWNIYKYCCINGIVG
jgi:hypothetical protein